MNTLQKNRIKPIFSFILFAAALAWTFFIFGMSMKSAPESSAMSRGLLSEILEYIHGILWFEIDFSLLHHFFRKLAHFTEYFILGFLTVGFVKSIKSRPVYSLIYCLIIGISDEILQFLKGAGRSMQIKDMALDFCGSLFAVFVFYLISMAVFLIINKRIKD